MYEKYLNKKRLILLLTGVITASAFSGTGSMAQVSDEGVSWLSDMELSQGEGAPPQADTVLPDDNQYKYQKDELAAFCHFGPNTFNEVEWGEAYGDKSPNEIFRLKDSFDAKTLVQTLKEAGFKKLIVTAKHHDGFCIWASDSTTYDVAATDYKNGNGDVLAEISAACTEANMDMGLYLSPWDIHDSSYGYKDQNGNVLVKTVERNGTKENVPIDGLNWEQVRERDAKDYNEFYNTQLTEILSNDKYGNNGKFVEVWMDGAKGSGSNYQEYDFKKWFETIQKYEGKGVGGRTANCMLFGADSYTTVRWIGNEKGYAAKNTWAKSTADPNGSGKNNAGTINSYNQDGFTVGSETGNQWTVPEADARITSGWFWGNNKKTPKTVKELGDMYFNSVGNNATLLLNIPPNDKGKVEPAILERVTEFGENVKNTFKTNLAKDEAASIKASSVRGNVRQFKPGNVIDGRDDTYWTTPDGTREGSLLIDLGAEKTFDVVSVEEAIQFGQRINSYRVEYRKGTRGPWMLMDSGQTIGAKRLCRSDVLKARQIKITVSTPEGKVPVLSEVGVYKATREFEKETVVTAGMDFIDITDELETDKADAIGFQVQSGTWTQEYGSNFAGGTSKWANPSAKLTLKFHGSKVYLLGTLDPGHGKAEIQIDGKAPVTVNTRSEKRKTGQRWFKSGDLEDGNHTLTLTVKDGPIGIDGAMVINNGGKGMIGLEQSSYTMNEDETRDVKIIRVGGTTGKVTAKLEPNPGNAVQGSYNTELITKVVLEDGESEATAQVQTKRNTDKTGNEWFTVELTEPSEDLILGLNQTAKITIKDMESGGGE